MRPIRRVSCLVAIVLLLVLIGSATGRMPVSAASAEGPRMTMVNIWATTCGYCIWELPFLQRISQEYAGEVEVVGLQLDAVYSDFSLNQAGVDKGKRLLAENGCTYTNMFPSSGNSWMLDYTTQGIPVTLFLDREGALVTTQLGAMEYEGWVMTVDLALLQLPSPAIPGDANNDGKVNILDLMAVIDWIILHKEPASWENANANGSEDGAVDILDLVWVIDRIVGG